MCGISMLSTNSIIIWCYQPQHIHPRITITYISEHIKPTQEFNRVFTYIPPRFRVIIPKPIVAQLNLIVIVLPLVFKRTPKILFSKALSGVAIEVLLAFPYQFTFLVIGFYGGILKTFYILWSIVYIYLSIEINECFFYRVNQICKICYKI